MTAAESNIQKEEQVNYRRYKDKVIICGMGVIIFGIWSVIKTYMMFLFSINELYVDGTAPETTEEKIFALIFVTVFSILVFSLHFYVGITAMKEAADPKNKKIFLFLGGLLFILALISVPSYFTQSYSGVVTDTDVASAISDFILCVVLGQMLIYLLRMKKIIKESSN